MTETREQIVREVLESGTAQSFASWLQTAGIAATFLFLALRVVESHRWR